MPFRPDDSRREAQAAGHRPPPGRRIVCGRRFSAGMSPLRSSSKISQTVRYGPMLKSAHGRPGGGEDAKPTSFRRGDLRNPGGHPPSGKAPHPVVDHLPHWWSDHRRGPLVPTDPLRRSDLTEPGAGRQASSPPEPQGRDFLAAARDCLAARAAETSAVHGLYPPRKGHVAAGAKSSLFGPVVFGTVVEWVVGHRRG